MRRNFSLYYAGYWYCQKCMTILIYDKMIYVVGNEQNYHFEILKGILLDKLGLNGKG